MQTSRDAVTKDLVSWRTWRIGAFKSDTDLRQSESFLDMFNGVYGSLPILIDKHCGGATG